MHYKDQKFPHEIDRLTLGVQCFQTKTIYVDFNLFQERWKKVPIQAQGCKQTRPCDD